MARAKSIPTKEITIRVPAEAWREYSGEFAHLRGGEPDPLGNYPREARLVQGVLRVMHKEINDSGGSFTVTADGNIKESE